MKPMKKSTRLHRAFFFLFTLAACGCAARVGHVTNLPAGVTETQAKNYDAAVGDLHKVALVTTTLRQTVLDLRGAGLFPDDAMFVTAIRSIAKIDEAQLAASAYLRDAPEYFAEPQKQKIRDIFASITAEIDRLNAAGVTGIKNPGSQDRIKNPGSQDKVNQLITELTSMVNLVLALAQ
jgi:hypothetical protein